MCFRSLTGGFSVNWDRLVHKTFTFMIAPFLKKIYADDKEAYIQSLKRNMEFFNITPQFHSFMGGLTIAMEEQNAKNENFDTSTINSVKAALMGPLSGIGDSVFPGTLRIIAAGIGISLAMQGEYLRTDFICADLLHSILLCAFCRRAAGLPSGRGFPG